MLKLIGIVTVVYILFHYGVAQAVLLFTAGLLTVLAGV